MLSSGCMLAVALSVAHTPPSYIPTDFLSVRTSGSLGTRPSTRKCSVSGCWCRWSATPSYSSSLTCPAVPLNTELPGILSAFKAAHVLPEDARTALGLLLALH